SSAVNLKFDWILPEIETPSRVWRRIQAADDLAVPSLPSLPAIDFDDLDDEDEGSYPSKFPPSTTNITASAKKSSTVRFADAHESFQFSEILPINHQSILTDDDDNKLPADYSVTSNRSKPSTPISVDKNVAVVRGVRTPSLTRSASLASTSPDATPSVERQYTL
ncbi:13972_t:CDS:2, partial [Acaulospora colombiana]